MDHDVILQLSVGRESRVMVRVLGSPAGEGARELAMPFTPDELAAIRRQLERPDREGGLRPSEIGRRLFDALFSGSILGLYRQSLGQAAPGILRLLLRFETAAVPELDELRNLPWELLFRPDTRDFLALDRRSPVVRYLEVPQPPGPVAVPSPARILAIVARPVDQVPLDAEAELDHLRQAWKGHADGDVTLLEHATLSTLRDALLARRCHVLHFIGHGGFDPESGDGALVLETPDGTTDLVRGETLAVKLRDAPDLRLVVLNACQTVTAAGHEVFSGVAEALVLGGVPAVLAMQMPIRDEAAVAFSRALYRRLAAGDTIELAVTEGRQAIHSLVPETSVEWAAPVLFSRARSGGTDDGRELRPRVATARLPATGRDLLGRDRELELLDGAWRDPALRILVLVAWGGVGKTSLVNHWLHRRQRAGYGGAVRVYGWSFYSQGTSSDRRISADEFIDDALAWFGDADAVRLSPWDRGARLADRVAEASTLLILDGLEPLQYPPGPLQGQLRDQGLRAFFKQLARAPAEGLCVVTTRAPIADLEGFEGFSARQVELTHLSPDAGVELLRCLGVEGEAGDLRKAAVEFEGHALALTLLGRFLAVMHDGDVRKAELVTKLTDEEEMGRHARRMLASYERWLAGSKELGVLYLLGLFDRPARAAALAALHVEEIFRGLSVDSEISEVGWRYAVRRLRDLHLLADDAGFGTGILDCHPLIREYFNARFKQRFPDLWIESNRRLFEHYRAEPLADQPRDLPELEPLFSAVRHGCEAHRYDEALEIFTARINRGKSYSTKVLGAFGANLAALSGFFEELWNRPVGALPVDRQIFVLNRVGIYLSAMGHIRESIAPTRRAFELHVAQDHWIGASKYAANLKEFHMKLGQLEEAVEYARLGVEYADRAGDVDHRIRRRTTLANMLHLRGEWARAEDLFREAESLYRESTSYEYLKDLNGFKLCSLLIDLGRFEEVGLRTEKMAGWTHDTSVLARVHFFAGLSLVTQAKRGRAADLGEARSLFDRSIDLLRRAGRQDTLPYPLMERAALKRLEGDLDGAWKDLEEAEEICREGQMRLNQVHIDLVKADLHLARPDVGAAAKHLRAARRSIDDMGYRRGELELERLESELERLSAG